MAGDSALLRVRFQTPQHTKISLWVDDELAYSIVASDSTDRLQPLIAISPGRHSIRVLMELDQGGVQEQRFISDFSIERQKELLLHFRGSEFILAWGVPSSLAGTVGSGWLGSSFGTLFLTIAGCIISGLTGKLVQDIPIKLP